MKAYVKPVEIKKIGISDATLQPDLLAIEEPLEIRLGFGPATDRQQASLAVTMRTPGHDFELAAGFLFTEALVQSMDDIQSIQYCADSSRVEERENLVRVELQPSVNIDFKKFQRNFYTTSSCGVCGKSSIESVQVNCLPITGDWKIHSSVISKLPEKLKTSQHVFEHTGGLHASGLFDRSGNGVIVREDVGRHNALDKVIGAMLMKKKLPLTSYLLLVSGRASFELLQKAARAGIPVVAAVGAPSSLAVDFAKAQNITLIGFVRDNRFNIYSVPKRISDS